MFALNDETSYHAEVISKLQHAPGYPHQSVFVIEECSELIKELTKRQRNKGSDERVKEEAIDVIASCYILLKTMEVSDYSIESGIDYKYRRAIERYEHNGEL